MKSIRIGNDIRIVWPIVLSGDVSKLKDLDLTVEVRPSKKIIDTHNYADNIDNTNENPSYIKSETTIMMNGGVVCRPDIGDGKEHCKPCTYPTRPIRPTDPVKLPYYIENNTLIAMWTADRQFAVGDYDIIVYAHKNGGGQAVADTYRFVRLVPHTAQADGPDNSGIEAVITMQPLTLCLSGLSAYEVAVVNGFQGSVEEWLESLKAGKLSSYVSVESIDNLPKQGDESTGYIIGTKLYIYVGTGGDTLEGKYKDVGEFRGPQGAPGSNGKSAYELAVEGGYEGSVEEWLLSLKGRDGVDGVNGADGLDGENGKDGVTPLIRWNNNRIEQSTDNGKSWWALSDKFNNKLYIKGYVTSADKLPKNALVGDMYGVGPIYGDDDVEQTKPYYQVYVNTVTDWAKSATITKVYQGDTELPQSAENNEIILIKKSTDNYLVYKYVNGSWNLLANLAEIYVEKDDIVNRGDNIFALVQSEIENQYELYERVVSWRNSGTFTSITAGIVNELGDSENAVMSQKAVTDAILNKLDLSAIDFDSDTLVKLAMCQAPTRFNVVKNNKSCGTMEVFSDDMGHMVTEVFETHYTLVDGELGTAHLDDKIFRYMRSYHISGGTSDIPVGTWGEWKQVYASDNNDRLTAVEASSENLSKNVGLDEYETFSDQKAYSAGDTVMYNGLLYTFTTDHAAGEWDESEVERSNLEKEAEKKYGSYIENEEFIRAYTDAEGKFLWGIRADGTVEWAKGIPTPVKEALRELESKINTDNGKFEEIETSLVALQDAVDVINASLKPLTDTFSFQDSPEFVNVVTDADGKVLFGLTAEGKPYFPKNTMYSVESNQEFLAAWLDSAGHVLFGLRTDGSTYVAKADFIEKIEKIQQLLKDNGIGDDELKQRVEALENNFTNLQDTFNNTFSIISNDEWLHAVVDAEGKLLFGIKAENGEVVMPKQDTYKVVSNDEWLAAWVDSQDKILFGVKADGTFWAAKSNFAGGGNYDEQIAEINETLQQVQDQLKDIDTSGVANTVFSVIDDAEERLVVTTDNEEKVLSYRDKDGVLHENKGFDTPKYYQNGKEKDFVDRSEIYNEVASANKNGAVKLENVEGVSNHNTPNLLIADEMQKTFNDGTNSFTPPNEGYEMSNPIECQAGDWFTRTGTATGMVVVTDENDKNGTRLFNADGTTLGSTFQIPESMTWVKYIRMAAEVVGAEDGSVVICKGKEAFTGEDRGDYLTVTKLRIGKRNLSKDVMYVKSEDGTKFYELYVDSTGALKAREIEPDVIPESDYPTTWYSIQLTGSFNGYCDRIPMVTNRYLWVMKATGPTNIKTFKQQIVNTYNTFDHYYNKSGEERFVTIYGGESAATGVKNGATIYDKDLNIIEEGIHPDSYGYDPHDVAYINDDHLIFFSSPKETINVPGIGSASILGIKIEEVKKINGVWQNVGKFESKNYPQLYTDAYGNLSDNPISSHINTLTLDYDGNLIVNCRNWESWIKIKRVENGDGTVTIGSKTHDYNEAIIGRVGGRHNSAYIDSKRVLNDGFSFTNTPASLTEISDDALEEWQWFHCHDVKYWGMKQIDGKQYPTYTLFDNNMWTGNSETGLYNATNKHNNITLNPNGNGSHYLEEYTSEDGYEEYQHSNVVQVSIDWENHLIKDYRVYVVPKLYTQQQGGATMFDEGIVGISYSSEGTFGIWDFTTEKTNITGHTYRGAKEVFKGKYDTYRICYRINAYKIK